VTLAGARADKRDCCCFLIVLCACSNGPRKKVNRDGDAKYQGETTGSSSRVLYVYEIVCVWAWWWK